MKLVRGKKEQYKKLNSAFDTTIQCARDRKTSHEYFQTDDERVYFFEPLEKEISIEDMQKIVDANDKLIKELKDVDG